MADWVIWHISRSYMALSFLIYSLKACSIIYLKIYSCIADDDSLAYSNNISDSALYNFVPERFVRMLYYAGSLLLSLLKTRRLENVSTILHFASYLLETVYLVYSHYLI